MGATATKERAASPTAKSTVSSSTTRQKADSAKATSQRRRRTAVKAASQTPKQEAAKEAAETKPRGTRNRDLGRKGEDAAERYLVHRGYEILERNWTCFAGEADIIAKDGRCLVFVEVKTRRNTDKGFPSEAVNAKKRERYEKIALAYATSFPESDMQVRFDVVSIVVIGKDKAMIRHHMNAFTR